MADLDTVVRALVAGTDRGTTGAYKRGEPCMRESFYIAYLDQATLTLTEAEMHFPEVLALCQGLAPLFGYVTARLVVDPPSQGRGPPFRAEGDVLVLPLRGEQRLVVMQSVQGLRMTAPRPQPLISQTVSPGDVVYVPQGLECRSEANEASTISLFLTVQAADQRLGTSLGLYITDALRESLPEDVDAFFRTAVTKGTLRASEDERRELEAKLQACTSALSSRLKASALREHFDRRMERRRMEQAEGAAKAQSIAEKASDPPSYVTTSSRIQVSRGVKCRCVAGESVAHFTRGGETLSLPIASTASRMISKLCDGRPHEVEYLPCDDPIERLCVAQVLVFKECLEVCAVEV